MPGQSYPSTLEEIDSWSREHGATTQEARIRFMTYVILHCIASREVTRKGMVLKGGNALRFAYQSPRSTKDLDFSVDTGNIPDNADRIRDLLDDALTFSERRFNVKAKCVSPISTMKSVTEPLSTMTFASRSKRRETSFHLTTPGRT
jgi:predicted nucleotidyltransferase component of viral defense system